MANPATITRDGAIAVITIDYPPVNALATVVRRSLLDAITELAGDDAVEAIVIAGAGRVFIAGADIREFGQPATEPGLPEVCNAIEACPKPVIAAIHGVALGGGLEVALAAHYRVALAGTKVGLPEVNLGILPGAGGTQRTTRLTGAGPALDLMLTGKHIPAEAAVDLGLIDRTAGGEDPRAAGIDFAKQLLVDGKGVHRTRDIETGLRDDTANRKAIANARASVENFALGLFSPFRIVDAVEAALDLPFDEGLARERELFQQCMDSPQREALIHVFFAEREVAKAPETRSHEPRRLTHIGIVGGGTMGAGITVAMLDGGYDVTMIERDDDALAAGRARVEKIYDRHIVKGRMDEAGKANVLDRFAGATDYGALADADLIIEAVFEDMTVKKEVFAALDRFAKPGAILATNTSYLDINTIAATTSRPGDVLGLHFFSPANIMRLLEVVVAEKTAPDVVATAFALAKRTKKLAVRAGVCDGFIGNRVLGKYLRCAHAMMEDGASPYEIDAAVREFGYPIGPFQMTDLAGGDIGWANRKRKAATRDPADRYVEIPDRICERGWFGQKTGRGYYVYADGDRKGVPNPDIQPIIDAERDRAGITPRSFAPQEIIDRYLAAMVNEAANALHDGIALRPLDIDMVQIAGYAFPRYRGGPMKYADSVGLDAILANIGEYARQDQRFWAPSPLLAELVARGEDFASLNTAS